MTEHVRRETHFESKDETGTYVYDISPPEDVGKMTHNGILYRGRFLPLIINGVVQSIQPSHSDFTIIYPDGKKYEGHINSKYLPHGYGKLYKQNQDGSYRIYYNGYYNNGIRSGKGVIYYTNCVYKGNFIMDKPNGLGELRYSNGDFYQGQVRNGRIHGNGVYTYASGFKIECDDFNMGVRHGTCTKTFQDGSQVIRQYQGRRSKRNKKTK